MTSISNIWKQLTSIQSNLNNFHSLEVVDRVSETQLQVGENSDWIIWGLKGWQWFDRIITRITNHLSCWAYNPFNPEFTTHVHLHSLQTANCYRIQRNYLLCMPCRPDRVHALPMCGQSVLGCRNVGWEGQTCVFKGYSVFVDTFVTFK